MILLAHYVGDIHQPLHVGAEYFDNGKFANPDMDKAALPDQGGNTFLMDLAEPPNIPGAPPAPRRRPKLHAFWDSNAVKLLIDEVSAEMKKADPAHPAEATPTEFDHYLAAHEPANWKQPETLPVKDWAEAWANEILPVAKEAYERLDFTQLKPESLGGQPPVISGTAVERPGREAALCELVGRRGARGTRKRRLPSGGHAHEGAEIVDSDQWRQAGSPRPDGGGLPSTPSAPDVFRNR